MKQVCLTCSRAAPGGSLFCQELGCPAERAPAIFGYGSWLGDIALVRPVTVLRTAVLYEARQQQKRVLVSLAHPGAAHAKRLMREAALLRELGAAHACLPTLLPPYAGAALAREPFGRAMLGDELRHYAVFGYVEGEPLRALLHQHPQLWVNQIGWIVRDLAAAIAVLQSRGRIHCAISPESVLVRFDQQTGAPRVLLASMGLASSPERIAADWYRDAVAPAYTAPELAGGAPQAGYAADVYGLGLLLYELLIGRPTLPAGQHTDEELYRMAEQGQRALMTRTEDLAPIAAISTQATSPDPAARPANAAMLATQLAPFFPAPRPRRRRLGAEGVLLIVAGLLALIFLVAVALTVKTALAGV